MSTIADPVLDDEHDPWLDDDEAPPQAALPDDWTHHDDPCDARADRAADEWERGRDRIAERR